MKKLFYKQTARILWCLVCCCGSISLWSQYVFWSEDFQGGVPNHWANYEISNPFIKWTWTTDVTEGLLSNQPHFISETVSNGFLMFNSDQLNSSHDVRLESTSIDCSNQSSVWLHFENQFAFFTSSSVALLGISTDSLTWTYDTLFTTLNQNQANLPLQVVELDISNIAANQPNVYLQFRWIGGSEYVWRLDDIRLQDMATPPPNYDLEIAAFAIPSNYATPFAHRKPMEMGVFVENNGQMDAQNVTLNTTIFDDVTNVVIHQDSTTIPSIAAGNSAILAHTVFFTPPNIGKYRLEYEVSQDSIDAFMWDNRKTNKFVISDTLFSKDNNTGFGTARPSIPLQEDYMIGNIYQAQTDGYFADEVIFMCGHPIGIPLNGFSVTAFLYEIDSVVLPDFSNFNDNHATQVGFGQYNFTSSSSNFSFFNTSITDINGDKVALKGGRFYFMVLSFAGSSSVLNVGVSDALTYSTERSSVINVNNSFNLNGFGLSIVPIIRMTITTESSDKNIQAFEGKVTIFPNPTSDMANVLISLGNDELSTIDIQVVNTLGQVIHQQQEDIFKEKHLEINTTSWKSGIYFIQIFTKKGQTTKRIVVK